MKIIVQTPRLIVREFDPADREKCVAMQEDDEVMKHISRKTRTELIAKFNAALIDYENGLALSRWGIYNPANNDFMGFCMLKQSDNDADKIELGYIFDKPYWGRGLATELATALVKYGLEDRKLTEICACTTDENIASQKVLLNAGLKREADIFWHGKHIPFFRIVKA